MVTLVARKFGVGAVVFAVMFLSTSLYAQQTIQFADKVSSLIDSDLTKFVIFVVGMSYMLLKIFEIFKKIFSGGGGGGGGDWGKDAIYALFSLALTVSAQPLAKWIWGVLRALFPN